MLATVVTTPSGDSAYNFVWVLIGIVTLFGAGGLLGVYKWAKKQGVRDSQLDLVIGVVLGDATSRPLKDRLDAQDRTLADIQREAKPNGGSSQRLGDTVKRIETNTGEIKSDVAELKGSTKEALEELRRRVAAVERRPSS